MPLAIFFLQNIFNKIVHFKTKQKKNAELKLKPYYHIAYKKQRSKMVQNNN